MSIERFVLIAVNAFAVFSLVLLPKQNYRKALLAFVVFQATTWFVSIMLVQFNIMDYPVRLFVKATRVNFFNEFLFYPSTFMWFVNFYPKDRSLIIKILHRLFFISISVWFIYFISTYTNLSRFGANLKYPTYIGTYIRFTIQYEICYFYINLFCKKRLIT